MIQPLLQDEAFLEDVARASAEVERSHLWWLGQSGFLLHWRRHFALLDPYLSDSLTRKYAQTNRPHVRITARVIAPERLSFVELATASHLHTDHCDAETLLPLWSANPNLRIVVPGAVADLVADRLRIAPHQLTTLNAGERATFGPFELHAVPAAHEQLEADSLGRHRFLGYVVRFDRWSVYHSGDTVLYSGMAEQLALFKPTVALLPINGRRPERRVAGNLWGREAARLAKDIGARWVIPCHFEMFEFNTEIPDEFVRTCAELEQPHRVLRAGERWTLPE